MKSDNFKFLVDGLTKLYDAAIKDMERELESENYLQAGKYQERASTISTIRQLAIQYELTDLREEA